MGFGLSHAARSGMALILAQTTLIVSERLMRNSCNVGLILGEIGCSFLGVNSLVLRKKLHASLRVQMRESPSK